MFRCERCGKEMTTEGARASHERSCTGGAEEGGRGGMKQCGRCGVWGSRSNYARHLRGCGGEEYMEEEEETGARVIRGKTKPCEVCGKVLTVRNMARHMDTQHQVWDPGGGPRP